MNTTKLVTFFFVKPGLNGFIPKTRDDIEVCRQLGLKWSHFFLSKKCYSWRPSRWFLIKQHPKKGRLSTQLVANLKTCRDSIFSRKNRVPRWWFQRFFIFIPICGRFPFWLIFFKGVETTTRFDLNFYHSALWLNIEFRKIYDSELLFPGILSWPPRRGR